MKEEGGERVGWSWKRECRERGEREWDGVGRGNVGRGRHE